MSSISPDIYAAAKVDGAGAISRFIHITLPNLSGYIAIALIIRGISEFNIFAMALVIFPHVLLTTLAFGLYTETFVGQSYSAAGIASPSAMKPTMNATSRLFTNESNI